MATVYWIPTQVTEKIVWIWRGEVKSREEVKRKIIWFATPKNLHCHTHLQGYGPMETANVVKEWPLPFTLATPDQPLGTTSKNMGWYLAIALYPVAAAAHGSGYYE